jgi:hypothetical protein
VLTKQRNSKLVTSLWHSMTGSHSPLLTGCMARLTVWPCKFRRHWRGRTLAVCMLNPPGALSVRLSS